MKTRWLAAVVMMSMLAGAAMAADEKTTIAEQAVVTQAVSSSLVRVEMTLQYDKGDAPTAGGWTNRCPSCGQYHPVDADESVQEERPIALPGFVLSPTQVIAPDFMIHPRFVKSVIVRIGDEGVEAQPAAYVKEQNAVIYELKKELKGAKALTFDAAKKGPYLAVGYSQENGEWMVGVQPLGDSLYTTAAGRRFVSVSGNCVIVDKAGAPVGMSMREELPPDDSWKGSPLSWASLSAAEMAKVASSTESACDSGLVRVALSFRSPKAQVGRGTASPNEDGDATERNVLGVALDAKRVLVLANLKPNVTARLQKIMLYPAAGDAVEATFAYSLADHGCFVATAKTALKQPMTISSTPVLQLHGKLLPAAEVVLQGEKRVAYYCHGRVPGFNVGWKGRIFPALPGATPNTFLFELDGSLAALPLAKREKVSGDKQYGGGSSSALLTPVDHLREALADPAKHSDPANVPLSEDDENRLAWMGVELQPLNRELARANNVSQLTRDGQSGGLVTYVYPDSPAAKAGIEAGYVLVRLHVQGQPKPLEVHVDEYTYADEPFPWDRLDEVGEQYFDQIPRPWLSAETTLTRALTDLGLGKKYTAEFSFEGKVVRKDFEIAQCPPHYDAAPRYKSEAMGLTVREVTFEVAHYLRKKADEPGVIVSKIEAGSRASVAGLKPYEIITHINDTPVNSVKDFARLVDGKPDELRLAVKRMTKGRLVKVKLTGPVPAVPKVEPEKP